MNNCINCRTTYLPNLSTITDDHSLDNLADPILNSVEEPNPVLNDPDLTESGDAANSASNVFCLIIFWCHLC